MPLDVETTTNASPSGHVYVLPSIAGEFDESEGTANTTISAKRSCRAGPAGEIVICATNPETYRLRPLDDSFRESPLNAQIDIGEGVTLAPQLDSGSVGGWQSNRVMATVRFGF